jgi:hypothetical protein
METMGNEGHMERYEYNVLTACVDIVHPVSRGFHEEYADELDLADAAERLARMLAEGHLFAADRDSHLNCPDYRGAPDYSGVVVCVPTVEEIASALTMLDGRFGVGLTARGAALWEAVAEPNWDLYIEESGDGFDKEQETWETHLWSRTKRRLEDAIRFRYAGEPVSGTQEWESVAPWRATYWKTLPEGYHVRLRTGSHPGLKDWTEEERIWCETLRWHRPFSALRRL